MSGAWLRYYAGAGTHLRGQERLVDLVQFGHRPYEQSLHLVVLPAHPRGRSYFCNWESVLPLSLSDSRMSFPTAFPGAPACSDKKGNCSNSKPRVDAVEEVQPPRGVALLA